MPKYNTKAVPPMPFTLVVKKLRGGFDKHEFDATGVLAAKRTAFSILKGDDLWTRATLKCRGEVVATIESSERTWLTVEARS